MLSAEIIAIGSELLTPNFVDTNSMYLTRQLNEIGIPVFMKAITGDDENYLEQAIRGSLERTPLIITIGGLGPTEDDITKKIVARVLRRQLVLDDATLAATLNFVVFDLAHASADVKPLTAAEIASERSHPVDAAAVRAHRQSLPAPGS